MKDRDAVVGGLRALAREDANLDVKALTGHPGSCTTAIPQGS
jgi:hypothetical protein